VDKSTKRRLEKLAKAQGKPLSELVSELYAEHLAKTTPAKPKP
jgi:hypothetical protein